MDFLKGLLEELNAMEQRDLPSIEKALGKFDGSLASIKPYITEPDTLPYGRKVVFASDDYEVVVCHHPPGTVTPIHDHGEAVGCVLVVSGMVINKTYRKTGWGTIELEKEEFVPKEYGFLTERCQIHAVQNPSHVSAVTVHVYTPSLAGHRIYEELPAYIASYI